MFLSYVDGQVVVRVDGEVLSAREAKVKFPAFAEQIDEYSKNAKKLSKLNLTSFTRETAKDNDLAYIHDIKEGVFFCVNDYIFAYKVGEGTETITEPYSILKSGQPETNKLIAKLKNLKNTKIDWVNGTYFINGKQVTKDNFNFVKHYLERVELLNTGEFVYETKPDLKLDNLILLSSTEEELDYGVDYKEIYSLSKNLRLVVFSSKQDSFTLKYCEAFCYLTYKNASITENLLTVYGFEKPQEGGKRLAFLNQVKTILRDTRYIEKALISLNFGNIVTLKIESLINSLKQENKKSEISTLKF